MLCDAEIDRRLAQREAGGQFRWRFLRACPPRLSLPSHVVASEASLAGASAGGVRSPRDIVDRPIGTDFRCTAGRYRRAMEDTRPEHMSCYIIIYNTPHSAALYSTAPHNPDLCPYSTPLFVFCVLSGLCKSISTSIRSISISIRTGCISLHTVLRRGGGCSLTRRENVVELSDAYQT